MPLPQVRGTVNPSGSWKPYALFLLGPVSKADPLAPATFDAREVFQEGVGGLLVPCFCSNVLLYFELFVRVIACPVSLSVDTKQRNIARILGNLRCSNAMNGAATGHDGQESGSPMDRKMDAVEGVEGGAGQSSDPSRVIEVLLMSEELLEIVRHQHETCNSILTELPLDAEPRRAARRRNHSRSRRAFQKRANTGSVLD